MAEIAEKLKRKKDAVNLQEDVSFETGDWLLVKFNMTEQNTRVRHFLGQVIGKEEEKLTGKFLRAASTKKNQGFVYSFPKEDDICTFSRTQVVKKVENPTPFGRYGLLLFNINISDF
jgi:hypothetical protein